MVGGRLIFISYSYSRHYTLTIQTLSRIPGVSRARRRSCRANSFRGNEAQRSRESMTMGSYEVFPYNFAIFTLEAHEFLSLD